MKEPAKAELEKLHVIRKGLLASAVYNKAALKEIKGNVHWEELTCVGYNPDLAHLEAVVSIKQSSGYSGGLCSKGSPEYVRFFVDWGSGFQDVGLTSFQAHDISDLPPGPQHPLQYMVYLELQDDKHKKRCSSPVLPKVRAVLSWNQIPSLNPNATPYFGNALDANIQIEPRPLIFADLLESGLIKISKDDINIDFIDTQKPLPIPDPGPLAWNKLIKTYRANDVPDHRLTYESVYPMLKPATSVEYMPFQQDVALAEKLDIKISSVLDILSKEQANTSYEELVCVGLNTSTDILGAVIHVKKQYGYSGSLCYHGSKEYVAFWADWDNNGTFDSYLGTAAVEVHDIKEMPKDGLHYSVMLPSNFTKRLKSCKTPNIVRIRAVLSWAVPPSTTDPNDLNYWGNRIDVVVQIRPGVVSGELLDLIYDVGGVPIENISPTTHFANPSFGVLDPTDCSSSPLDRPFGGNVRIGGRIYNTGSPGSVYYQVQYAPLASSSWLPVTHNHVYELMHPNPFDPLYPKEVVTYNSPDGWFPYLENPLALPPILERTSRLAVWNTGSLNGHYKIRMIYTKDYPVTPSSVIHYSDVVTIKLDNINYTVSPTPNSTVDTAYSLDLVIDGGDCHSYSKGTIINGHLRALDTHFWRWILELQPTTHTHGTVPLPRCRSYASLADNGDANAAWTLDTSALDKCGYTIMLHGYDRAIINSNGAVVHYNKKAVGFSVV